jgi:hypothetical protein
MLDAGPKSAFVFRSTNLLWVHHTGNQPWATILARAVIVQSKKFARPHSSLLLVRSYYVKRNYADSAEWARCSGVIEPPVRKGPSTT